MTFAIELGERIRQARLSARLTLAEVGRLVNLSTSCICNYENGKRFPSIETLSLMSQLFGVSLDELVPYAELEDSVKNEADMMTIYDLLGEIDG